MVLEGPARGEIHGWESGGWYNGFEAPSFLDWRYDEWPGEDQTNRAGDIEGGDETDGITPSAPIENDPDEVETYVRPKLENEINK
jgi:hypothetical protein